jgi:hypothetical protein
MLNLASKSKSSVIKELQSLAPENSNSTVDKRDYDNVEKDNQDEGKPLTKKTK